MSGGDWGALIVVVASAGWVAWRVWRWWNGRGKGGCDNCPK